MSLGTDIPYPINFNPLKHHLGCIRNFASSTGNISENSLKRETIPLLKHIGNSVADIYTGEMSIPDIVSNLDKIILKEKISTRKRFAEWMEETRSGYRKITLSDESGWVIKYLSDKKRYLHIFPGRNIKHTTRSRGNSLKTAILYVILFDKGDIILSDLNAVRKMLSLSPLAGTGSAGSIINCIRLIQD